MKLLIVTYTGTYGNCLVNLAMSVIIFNNLDGKGVHFDISKLVSFTYTDYASWGFHLS